MPQYFWELRTFLRLLYQIQPSPCNINVYFLHLQEYKQIKYNKQRHAGQEIYYSFYCKYLLTGIVSRDFRLLPVLCCFDGFYKSRNMDVLAPRYAKKNSALCIAQSFKKALSSLYSKARSLLYCISDICEFVNMAQVAQVKSIDEKKDGRQSRETVPLSTYAR
jgi:hypothetical protein